jgi:hypothetical protein
VHLIIDYAKQRRKQGDFLNIMGSNGKIHMLATDLHLCSSGDTPT